MLFFLAWLISPKWTLLYAEYKQNFVDGIVIDVLALGMVHLQNNEAVEKETMFTIAPTL